MSMEELRFPVGRFDPVDTWTRNDIDRWIDVIAACPDNLRAAVRSLTDEQLDTPYRPDGWTVRQVVHHVLDSHMNALIRIKLGLTEDTPRITAYDQDAWSALADYRLPIEGSLAALEGVHERLVVVLRKMEMADYDRKIDHPENGVVSLGWMAQMYRWHSLHHVAHITELRDREGWH